MSHTPSFWWHKKLSWKAYLLLPLGSFYAFLTSRRRVWKEKETVKASVPVISIGNLVMGGAGKTPVTLALAALLQEKGFHPIGLTRGYGGETKGPCLVDSSSDSWRKVGDEALLLAQEMPTFVARQRAKALSLIPSKEQMVILLDDGHQHVSLHKYLSLLVMNEGQQHGNEQVFPAGPLRESLEEELRRAQALIWIGSSPSPSLPIPVLRASLSATSPLRKGQRVLGFAGIGYPDKFAKTLKELGLKVVDFRAFPDHCFYRKEDLKALQKLSHGKKAHLITTEKDMMRLPRDFREQVFCVKVKIVWENPQAVEDFIGEYL